MADQASRRRVLAAGLLALAGCSGARESSDGDPTSTETSTETRTETSTEKPESTPDEEVDRVDNPYGSETLVVQVVDKSSVGYDRDEELQEAFDFWESNAEEYAGFPIAFERDDDAPDPHVVVRFVDGIESCGYSDDDHEHTGCAHHVGDVAPSPARADVVNWYRSVDVAATLKHEFGHLLGLGHDDDPAEVMEPQEAVYVKEASYDYYYTASEEYDAEAVRRQVTGAVSYMNDGGSGHIKTDLELTAVGSRSDADLLLEVEADDGACSGYFCMSKPSDEPDYAFTTSNVDADQVGYVLAVGLYRYFVARRYAMEELPPELHPDEAEPSSEWWE